MPEDLSGTDATDPELVADKVAAAVGQDGRATGQARPALDFSGGRSGTPVGVRSHVGPDPAATSPNPQRMELDPARPCSRMWTFESESNHLCQSSTAKIRPSITIHGS
jgi:hypothetical protein